MVAMAVTRDSFKTIRRLADAAGVTSEELRHAFEDITEMPTRVENKSRRTGARWVRGQSGGCYVYDPEGVDVVSPGMEPPPGYFGP
jgi:hypothetical protein